MNIRIYKENEDPNLSIQNCRQNRWGIDDRTQQMTYNFFWIRSRQSLMMGDRRVRILWIHSSCDVLACDLGSPPSLSLPVSKQPDSIMTLLYLTIVKSSAENHPITNRWRA